MLKHCNFLKKMAEIRENLSETGKNWLVATLPKANLYFPDYAGIQNSRGLKKLVILECEVIRLRAIEKLFRMEAGVLQTVLRQRLLPMTMAFQISHIKNNVHDMLAKKTYAEQIKRLRQL